MRSDDELLQSMQAGESAAFSQLVERYHSRLVRLAQSVVFGQELAEDVAQETWIAVMRGVERFEGRSTFRTWLFRICVNRARSIGGREYRFRVEKGDGPAVDPRRFSGAGAWAEAPGDWTDSIDDRLVATELVGVVLEAIEGLSEGQRQVVTLRDVEGLSSKEVCEVLDISAPNERVLLHRGRSRVRSALEQKIGGG